MSSMHSIPKRPSIAAAFFVVAGIAGCGGGESTPNTFTGDGLYGGTLTGTDSNTFRILVLENNEIWVFVGDGAAGSFSPQGFIEGPATFENGAIVSSSLRDFRYGALSGSNVATASGAYSEADRALSLRIAYSMVTFTLNGAVVPSGEYNYNLPASLAEVTGSWGLSASGLEAVGLTISPSGAATGSTGSGCAFSGMFKARSSGRNVFDVTLTFTAAQSCVLSGQTVSGVALVLARTSGGNRLTMAFRNGSRTTGYLASGTR